MRKGGNLFTSLCILLCALALLPNVTQAAFSAGSIKYCTGIACPCDMGPGPKGPCSKPTPRPAGGVLGCFCEDEANGIQTTGQCTAVLTCTGKATGGIDGKQGGVDAGLAKILESLLGKAMEALKGGGGGGGGSEQGGGQGYSPTQQYPACVHNTATNTVSPVPCTETNGQINYGTSGTSGTTSSGGTIGGSTAETLLNSLNGTSNESSTNTNTNANANTNTNTSTNTNTNTNTSAATTSSESDTGTKSSTQVTILSAQQGTLTSDGTQQGMLQGDLIVGQSGGMLYARSRDPNSNTEVAGFYGGNTFGQSQSSSLIGRMCSTRPWGEGVLGGLISGTFFDGLCKRFGYQVGAIAVTPGGGGGTTTTKRPTITITQNPAPRPATTSVPTIQPEVDIWANPSSVRLGTRTYIFWNTRGVDSCIEAGPNFSHNTLSGGASTVPLSDASTFTIECKTVDGQTVRDSVRVNLAL